MKNEPSCLQVDDQSVDLYYTVTFQMLLWVVTFDEK